MSAAQPRDPADLNNIDLIVGPPEKPGAGCRETSWRLIFYSVALEGYPQATTLIMTTYTWDEAKRKINLRKHGLDFADAPTVLEASSYSTEDTRFPYSERRYNALGYFHGDLVSITYTEQNDEIRIISFRRATRRERRNFI
jgi:uncharacterized DUF497 family protein